MHVVMMRLAAVAALALVSCGFFPVTFGQRFEVETAHEGSFKGGIYELRMPPFLGMRLPAMRGLFKYHEAGGNYSYYALGDNDDRVLNARYWILKAEGLPAHVHAFQAQMLGTRDRYFYGYIVLERGKGFIHMLHPEVQPDWPHTLKAMFDGELLKDPARDLSPFLAGAWKWHEKKPGKWSTSIRLRFVKPL